MFANMRQRCHALAAAAAVACACAKAEQGERGARCYTNGLGMALVRVEAGRFRMGQDGPTTDYLTAKHPGECDRPDWDEAPAHEVRITRPFYIGATEVTLGQYRRFKPEHLRDKEGDGEAVTAVSWHDAVAFCAWLSQQEGRTYRLPTEAEWEYACRAGSATCFSMGDTLPRGSQPWFGDAKSYERYFGSALPPEYAAAAKGASTVRVAQRPPNGWGLYDLHGNVAEWCEDVYGPYEAGAQADPVGRRAGEFRVFRGGHHSTFSRLLRSANRGAWIPEAKSPVIGFRVVQAEPSPGKALPPAPLPLNARDVSQAEAAPAPADSAAPYFAGPEPFVRVPPRACGPQYAWHNHSPSLTECPNGDLLAVWYSCVDEAGSELCNLASRLRRGAGAWEPASPFWDGADVNDHAPKVWWDGDRTLYHFARGLSENVVRTSTDNGATWSPASIIQPVGEFGNRLLRLKDGTLVLGNDARHVSLVASKDGGRTWTFNEADKKASDFRPGGKGLRYPGIHAPLVQLADGRIMAVSRLDKPEEQAAFGFKTPVSVTSDLGKSWSYEATEFPAISSVQRAAMIRLREGPILLCSFTDQWRDWKSRKGMAFNAADGGTFKGYGLFAALSYDEGKSWPVRRLVTPGGAPREANAIDRVAFTLSDAMAEPCGYLDATQTRDGRVQLITSKNHYVFNLAWLTALPTRPQE